MDREDLERYHRDQWNGIITRGKNSLDQFDREPVERCRTWDDFYDTVLNDEPPESIVEIHPSLEHFHKFTTFFSMKLTDSLDTAFVWGTLACLLNAVRVADEEGLLEAVPEKLKRLIHQAETFNALCDSMIVVDNATKETCFNMQRCYVDLFVTSIRYIHNTEDVLQDHAPGGGTALGRINHKFDLTSQFLQAEVSKLERIMGIRIPFRVQSPSKTSDVPSSVKQRLIMHPENRTDRLFNRTQIFDELDVELDPNAGKTFKSVALHGLGGVGKSSVASTYMEKKYNEGIYDFALWAHGETPTSLSQSFTKIALRLKLPGAQPQNHGENLILVQEWFQSSVSPWIIVYDNVEDADTIMPFWPASSQGRAIITTRYHGLVFRPAGIGLEVNSWDAEDGSKFLLFLLKQSIGKDLTAETTSALALSEKLSGHALALSHMAAIIFKGQSSVKGFSERYLKNPRRVLHAKDPFSALWQTTFQTLDAESLSLLGTLSFLMPDDIPKDLLEADEEEFENLSEELTEDLDFFADEESLIEASEKLAALALIKKDKDTGTITIHRMVQAQVKQFLGIKDRQRSFNNAVMLLFRKFPGEELARGQLYDQWAVCNQYLQHVLKIKDCFMEERKDFKAPREFCSLLSSCQRFLSEMNAMKDLLAVCDANLIALKKLENGPQKTDLRAAILSHQAQAAESLGDPLRAIELNKEVYQIRLEEQPTSKLMLCFTANNLGYCHNTANRHHESESWYEQSNKWWKDRMEAGEELRDRPARHIKNHARCLVYLGKFEEASKMFDISIDRLKNEKPLNWAMLGYALFAQATMCRCQHNFSIAKTRYVEAQNVWRTGDQSRVHPFYAACQYKVGVCYLDQGEVPEAIMHLRQAKDLIKVSEVDRPVEYARTLFKLSEALVQDGKEDTNDEAAHLRDEAERLLKVARPTVDDCGTENAYDEVVPIFWR